MSDLLDVDQVRAMATPAGSLWAGERAPTALALARTALEWFARWSTVHAAEEARDLAIAERDEAYRQRDEARKDVANYERAVEDARAILGARPDELLSDAAARAVSDVDRLRTLASIVGLSELATWDDLAALLRGLAGAEPPQVFRIDFEVTIGPDCAGKPCATLRLVQPIRDPGFLALSGHQLSRLGLVVCDG